MRVVTIAQTLVKSWESKNNKRDTNKGIQPEKNHEIQDKKTETKDRIGNTASAANSFNKAYRVDFIPRDGQLRGGEVCEGVGLFVNQFLARHLRVHQETTGGDVGVRRTETALPALVLGA